MTEMEKEASVSGIMSGLVSCTTNQKLYLIKTINHMHVVKSKEIYEYTYRKARIIGAMTDKEIGEVMGKNGLWNLYNSELLKMLPKQIENLKVDLYNAYYKLKRKDNIQKNLVNKKLQYVNLTLQREEFRDLTCEGIAELAKRKFLIGMSTTDEVGKNLYDYDSISKADDSFLRKLVTAYYAAFPTEEDIRYVIQHEPWRGYWSSSKVEGSLFGCSASSLTELQRIAIMWSKIYDSVIEHPESPPEDLIADNDLLDGWLIAQGRKRDEDRKKQFGEKHVEKARGADEVFVMVEDVKDIQRVSDMMTPEAKMVKNQRMRQIEAQGSVHEQHMADSRVKIQAEAVRQMRQHIASGKKGK